MWCQTCKKRDETKAIEDGKDPTKVTVYKYIGESSRTAPTGAQDLGMASIKKGNTLTSKIVSK